MTVADAIEDGDVVVECGLEAPVEKVWRALTVPELAADWLGAMPSMNPRQPDNADNTFEIVDAQPFSSLTYRWREVGNTVPLESLITVEIASRGPDRTWFRLIHRPPDMRLMAANGNVPMALAA